MDKFHISLLVLLGIAIIFLGLSLVLEDEKVEPAIKTSTGDTLPLESEEKVIGQDVTEQDCVELAHDVTKGYINCVELLLVEVYGMTDGVLCGLAYTDTPPCNKENRISAESKARGICRQGFSLEREIIANCLSDHWVLE